MTDLCLRTIDQTRQGPLLRTTHASADSGRATIEAQALPKSGKPLWLARDLLTTAECQEMVQTAHDTFGFSGLTHAYAKQQRDAQRLCVLDADLAELLWRRLTTLPSHGNGGGAVSVKGDAALDLLGLIERANVRPFGFDAQRPEDRWIPVSINPCMRLSRYDAPSVGFQPHFDSQYCQSFGTRSALSLVVYLSASGETVFYDHHPPDASAADKVDGLTTQEEIALHGGLAQYAQHTVSAVVGTAILFPHDVLHAGAPLPASAPPKLVLRTDVIFVRTSTTPTLTPSPSLSSTGTTSADVRSEFRAYEQCLHLFREAQNQEVDGHVARASDLYERALSMRKARRVETLAAKSERGSVSVLGRADIWMMVLGYATLQDLAAFRCIARTGRALCQRYTALFWLGRKLAMSAPLVAKITAAGNGSGRGGSRSSAGRAPVNNGYATDDGRLLCSKAARRLFIPKLVKRAGQRCFFQFGDAAFVRAHLDGCLRVLAAYALFQFGLPQDAKTFVAQYDPARQTVLKCPVDWLLTCAFYQLPCAGRYYHVYKTAAHDQAADAFPYGALTDVFDGRRSEDDDTEDGDGARDASDDDDSNARHKAKRKRRQQRRASAAQTRDRVLEPHEAFRAYVDKHCALADAAHQAAGADMFAYLSGRDDKRRYKLALLQQQASSGVPGYYEITHTVTRTTSSACQCGIGDRGIEEETDDASLTTRYNNLICDFAQRRLRVRKLDSAGGAAACQNACPLHRARQRLLERGRAPQDEWVADLTEIALAGFNHASCQCGPEANTVEFTDQMTFSAPQLLDHLHLWQDTTTADRDGDALAFVTEYHAINAL